MGDAARFALAIMILFIAMVAFFVAFHPNTFTIAKDTNPLSDLAQWLTTEFDKGTATPGSPAQPSAAQQAAAQSAADTAFTNAAKQAEAAVNQGVTFLCRAKGKARARHWPRKGRGISAGKRS